MRGGRIVLGIVLVLLGALWFLQGIGVAKGSTMTGDRFWSFVGTILVAAGAWLLIGAVLASRRRDRE